MIQLFRVTSLTKLYLLLSIGYYRLMFQTLSRGLQGHFVGGANPVADPSAPVLPRKDARSHTCPSRRTALGQERGPTGSHRPQTCSHSINGERPPQVPLRQGGHWRHAGGKPATSPFTRACPEPAEGGTMGGNPPRGANGPPRAGPSHLGGLSAGAPGMGGRYLH